MTEWAIVRLHRLADRAEDLASYLEKRLQASTANCEDRPRVS
jgi:hypothetical protein